MLNSIKYGVNRLATRSPTSNRALGKVEKLKINAQRFVDERPHVFNEYYLMEKAPGAIIVGVSAYILYSIPKYIEPCIKCNKNGCVVDEPQDLDKLQDKKPTLK